MTISATSQGLRPGVCTSSNRPANPYDGMMIYETDTNLVRIWNGTAWKTLAYSDYTSGSVIQVASTTKTDTFSSSLASAATAEVTGLTVSITPTSTASKIYVSATVYGRNSNQNGFQASLARGGTLINTPASAGSRTVAGGAGSAPDAAHVSPVHLQFLDSPATTSSTTYSVYVHNSDVGTRTVYVNRTENDTNAVDHVRTSSVITVMEIAG